MKLLGPLINDLTTDTEDPPVFGAGGPGPFPERFAAVIHKHYANLACLRLDAEPADAFRRSLEIAQSMPRWAITREDPDAGIFEGVVTTSICRFKDDFVVRVRPDEGGARVDMRSRSRLGKGDFGANAERIRDFFSRLS